MRSMMVLTPSSPPVKNSSAAGARRDTDAPRLVPGIVYLARSGGDLGDRRSGGANLLGETGATHYQPSAACDGTPVRRGGGSQRGECYGIQRLSCGGEAAA